MRKIILSLTSAFLMTGCAHVFPVTVPFPTPPNVLLEGCDDLNTLRPDPKLSDLMVVVTENYTKYHVCKEKNQAWRDWYTTQKSIYDSLNKK